MEQKNKTPKFMFQASMIIFLVLNLVFSPFFNGRFFDLQKASAQDQNNEQETEEEKEDYPTPEPIEPDLNEIMAGALMTASNQLEEISSFTASGLLGQKIVLDNLDRQILNAYLAPDEFAKITDKKRITIDQSLNELFDLAFDEERVFNSIKKLPDRQQFKEKIEEIIAKRLEIKWQEIITTERQECQNLLSSEDASQGLLSETKKKTCAAVALSNLAASLKSTTEKEGEIRQLAKDIAATFKKLVKDPWWTVLQPFSAEIIKTTFKPLSVRTVNALIYLVAPKKLGGAGHERIKVSIWSPAAAKNAEKNQPSVKRHEEGEAFDLEEADSLRCTIFKKGWVKKKVTPQQPALPIKMAYQSDEGISSSRELPNFLRSSMHQAFLATGADSWLDIFQLDGNEVLNEALEKGDLGNIAKGIGLSALEQIINSPSGAFKGINLEEILENIGLAMIADDLGLPREGLKGDGLEEIEANLGRVTLEEKMNLPIGSLKGGTPAEIFTSVGQRKVETLLKLREGSLAVSSPGSPEMLQKIIGQAKIEEAVNVKKGVLDSDKIEDFKKKIPPQKWEYLKSTASQLDEALHLEFGKTNQLLFSANPDLNLLKILVGMKTLEEELFIYHSNTNPRDENQDNLIQERAWGIRGTGEIISRFKNGDLGVFEEIGKGELANNLAAGEKEQQEMIEWFSSNGFNGAYSEETMMGRLGIDEGEFERLFTDRFVVTDRFLTKEQNKIQINSVFRLIGKKRLAEAGKTLAKKIEPIAEEVEKVEREIGFYRDRVGIIQDDTNKIDKIFNRAETNPYYSAEEKAALQRIKESIKLSLKHPSINNFKAAVKMVRKELDTLEAINASRKDDLNLSEKVRQQLENDTREIKKRIENIRHAITEIIAGEVLARGINDVSNAADNLGQKQNQTKFRISPKQLLEFLSGMKNGRQFLRELGAAKLEDELSLPSQSIYFFLYSKDKNIGDFTQAIGQAAIEETLNLPSNSFLGEGIISIASKIEQLTKREDGVERLATAFYFPKEKFALLTGEGGWKTKGEEYDRLKEQWGKSAEWKNVRSSVEQIDQRFRITSGSTEQMLQGLISPAEYKARVGREKEKVSAVGQLNNQFGANDIWGYRLTGEDIYNLLSGDGSSVFAKIGGKQLEDQLELRSGSGIKLLNARTSEERLEIIAENGFARWAKALGVVNHINKMSGNLRDNIGDAKVEEMLGLLPNTFYGQLSEVQARNGNWRFALAFRVPIDDLVGKENLNSLLAKIERGARLELESSSESEKTKILAEAKTAQEKLDKISAEIGERIKLIIGKGSLYWQTPTEEIDDFTGRQIKDFQLQIASIDAAFGIPAGSSKKLLIGELQPLDYSGLVGNKAVSLIPTSGGALDAFVDTLGFEGSQKEGWKNIIAAVGKISQKGQVLSAADKAATLDGFQTIFDLDLDKNAHFRTGTISKMLRYPTEAKSIFIAESILELETQIGLAKSKDNAFVPDRFDDRDFGGGAWLYNTSPVEDIRIAKAFHDHPLYTLYRAYEYRGLPALKDVASAVVAASITNSIDRRLKDLTKNNFREEDYAGMRGDLAKMLLSGNRAFLVNFGMAVYIGGLNGEIEIDGVKRRPPENMRLTYQDVQRQVVGLLPQVEGDEVARAREEARNSAEMAWNSTSGKTTEDLLSETNRISADSSNPIKIQISQAANYRLENGTFISAEPQREEQAKQNFINTQVKAAEDRRRDEINEQKNDFTFKTVDIFLWRKDVNVPAGFAKKIIKGSDEDRRDAVLSWLSQKHLGDPTIGPALIKFLDPNNKDPGKVDTLLKQISASGFALLDGELSELFGTTLPAGTAKALVKAIGGDWRELNKLGKNIIKEKTFGLVDEQLGLRPGTTQRLYDVYNLYKAYNVAKKTKDLANIKAARAKFKAALIAIAVDLILEYYGEQIAKFEQKHQLVQGSISMGISAGVSVGLAKGAAAGWWVGIGVFVAVNLFGFHTVKLVCTADGYWPMKDPELNNLDFRSFHFTNGSWKTGGGQIITDPILISRLEQKKDLSELAAGEFDGLGGNNFEQGVRRASQMKTRQIIINLLDINESKFYLRLKDKNFKESLVPTQMWSLRKEDEEYLQSSGLLDRHYGNYLTRGNSGYWADPKATYFAHFGY